MKEKWGLKGEYMGEGVKKVDLKISTEFTGFGRHPIPSGESIKVKVPVNYTIEKILSGLASGDRNVCLVEPNDNYFSKAIANDFKIKSVLGDKTSIYARITKNDTENIELKGKKKKYPIYKNLKEVVTNGSSIDIVFPGQSNRFHHYKARSCSSLPGRPVIPPGPPSEVSHKKRKS